MKQQRRPGHTDAPELSKSENAFLLSLDKEALHVGRLCPVKAQQVGCLCSHAMAPWQEVQPDGCLPRRMQVQVMCGLRSNNDKKSSRNLDRACAQGLRKRLRSASTSSLGGPSYGAGVCSHGGSVGPSAGAGAGAVAMPRHAQLAAVSSGAAAPAPGRAHHIHKEHNGQ